MKSVFWILVRKDLYLLRGLMIATIAAGVLAMALVLLGGIGFAVGGILFLTANVAGALFVAIFTVFNERKEQTRAFSLSLPVSGVQYERAKIVAGYLAFLRRGWCCRCWRWRCSCRPASTTACWPTCWYCRASCWPCSA